VQQLLIFQSCLTLQVHTQCLFQQVSAQQQQGVHVTTAQRLLGHSDPRVTMGIYTQVLDNEIDDVGLLLSKAAGY
jgi:integrase